MEVCLAQGLIHLVTCLAHFGMHLSFQIRMGRCGGGHLPESR